MVFLFHSKCCNQVVETWLDREKKDFSPFEMETNVDFSASFFHSLDKKNVEWSLTTRLGWVNAFTKIASGRSLNRYSFFFYQKCETFQVQNKYFEIILWNRSSQDSKYKNKISTIRITFNKIFYLKLIVENYIFRIRITLNIIVHLKLSVKN